MLPIRAARASFNSLNTFANRRRRGREARMELLDPGSALARTSNSKSNGKDPAKSNRNHDFTYRRAILRELETSFWFA
eukprot:666626-Rhodomonas_salina.1